MDVENGGVTCLKTDFDFAAIVTVFEVRVEVDFKNGVLVPFFLEPAHGAERLDLVDHLN